jgi:hypothetical protein
VSDRTSAGIFGLVFEHLAKQPDERAKKFAAVMWKEATNYDFDYRQMYVDEALIELGLAKRGVDPDYPEDGETVLYKDGRGWSP